MPPRDKLIRVRVSAADKARIQAQADKRGESLSEYVRMASIKETGRDEVRRDPDPIPAGPVGNVGQKHQVKPDFK